MFSRVLIRVQFGQAFEGPTFDCHFGHLHGGVVFAFSCSLGCVKCLFWQVKVVLFLSFSSDGVKCLVN